MTTPKYAGGMGFRDIDHFNLSLLARQAWRILQNPETLSAKILKAVYYPDNDFLESQVGSHPSKIWRAIVDGKEVLRQGLIRRNGTGEKLTHGMTTGYREIQCSDHCFARKLSHRVQYQISSLLKLRAGTWRSYKNISCPWILRSSWLYQLEMHGLMTFGLGMVNVQGYSL
jgi:hypothetical protein